MKWVASTLWDLLSPGLRPVVPRSETIAESIRRRGSTAAAPAPPRRRRSMQERYDALVEEMKNRYQVRVRKWRSSSSGVAWSIRYRGGSVVQVI